jgi:hypothetical protein
MKKYEYCLLTEVWISNPYSTKIDIEYPDPGQQAEFISEGMKLVEAINHLGADGWDAVTLDSETVENGTVTKVLFKRRIAGSDDD